MNVEMLEVGTLIATAGLFRAGDDPGETVRLPVPAWVIETESERVLVDTGLHPAAVADPRGHYGDVPAVAVFGMEQERGLADQLDLDTVTRVVLTHLHFDHAGALALIPSTVPVVVQRAEWEAGHDAAASARNFFLPRDYAGRDVTLVDGDHDLLGDGSVWLLATPGHTPGHQSVQAGDLVIGADVAPLASALDDHRFPVFGDDLDAQAESARRLALLRGAGHTVMPGHDPAVLRPGPVARRTSR